MTRPSFSYCNATYIEMLNKTTKNPPCSQGTGRDAIYPQPTPHPPPPPPTLVPVGALPHEPPCSVMRFGNYAHFFFRLLTVVLSYMYVSPSICHSPALLSISLHSAVSSLLNDVRRVDEPRIDDRLLCRMQHLKELF
jgi:hypothetical protein